VVEKEGPGEAKRRKEMEAKLPGVRNRPAPQGEAGPCKCLEHDANVGETKKSLPK